MPIQNEKILPDPKVKNSKTPCLTDLKKFAINLYNLNSMDDEYEIVFIDYAFPNGIDSLAFVKKELKDVVRMEVYAPMITDALFNLNQKCYNNLYGKEIIMLLREGINISTNKGYRGAKVKPFNVFRTDLKPFNFR